MRLRQRAAGSPLPPSPVIANSLRLDRRDRNNIVGTLPVLDRDVVRDGALDRLPRDERAPGFHLEIDQHRFS